MGIRPITDTLRLLHGGLFIDECSDKLSEIVKGVDETGKAGKLTITLDVKKVGAAISVLAKVTDKTPEEPADADLFYPTVEGNLSVDNPNQRKLDLRVADEPKREVRNVDPETGEIRNAG
jgi:hypothetical protein